MNGLELAPGYENIWNGEADCFALPIDDTTYFDLFTQTAKNKIETPLDRQGVVDKTELALAVLKTAPPGYYWGTKKRKHHWQWPESLYPNLPAKEVNPRSFRELSLNKEKLPLSFERRLHVVSLHPPLPEDEVMAQKIEAFQAANMLFRTAREIIQWQRKVRRQRIFTSTDSLATMNNPDKKNKHFHKNKGQSFARGFRMHLQRYYEVPPEFRLVETGGSAEQVAVDLGRVLGERALKQALVSV